MWGIHSASKGCGGQCGGYIVLARGVVDSVGIHSASKGCGGQCGDT